MTDTNSTHRQLFLDCDGVLADFDTAAEQLFGMRSRDAQAKLGPKKFWQTLRAREDFYGRLPLMSHARMLFDAVEHLNPIILTGCPLGGWAESQKHRWAAAHFPGTKMITCMARDKRIHMKAGDVLVDDLEKFRSLWEDAGGVFIHHISAAHTIAELKRIGLLYPGC